MEAKVAAAGMAVATAVGIAVAAAADWAMTVVAAVQQAAILVAAAAAAAAAVAVMSASMKSVSAAQQAAEVVAPRLAAVPLAMGPSAEGRKRRRKRAVAPTPAEPQKPIFRRRQLGKQQGQQPEPAEESPKTIEAGPAFKPLW
mmetsp:Transcript_12763/g.38489  ORF Transcript_12763/g.38489 Transcript_12763/m.38489 type:complete len:143 (+) Transcript_12763:5830-6258(+)